MLRLFESHCLYEMRVNLARHGDACAAIQRDGFLQRVSHYAARVTRRQMAFDFSAKRRVEFAVQKTGQLGDQCSARR